MALAGQNSQDISEFEAVGVSIAKKLQRMDSRQSILAESLINTIRTKGLLNRLTDQTNVCDGLCKMLVVPQSSRPTSEFSTDDETSRSSWENNLNCTNGAGTSQNNNDLISNNHS